MGLFRVVHGRMWRVTDLIWRADYVLEKQLLPMKGTLILQFAEKQFQPKIFCSVSHPAWNCQQDVETVSHSW